MSDFLFGLWAVLKAFPEIVELIKAIRKVQADLKKEEQIKIEVKDSVKAVTDAFKTKDPEALRRLFNS